MQRGTQNAHHNERRHLAVEAQSQLRRRLLMTPENKDSHQSCGDYSDRLPSPDGMLENRDSGVSRRELLGMTAATLLMAGSLGGSTKPDSKNGIPYRTLGRTGEKVSVIGLGGYHLGKQSDPQESIQIIRTGIDEGINFLDNCW